MTPWSCASICLGWTILSHPNDRRVYEIFDFCYPPLVFIVILPVASEGGSKCCVLVACTICPCIHGQTRVVTCPHPATFIIEGVVSSIFSLCATRYFTWPPVAASRQFPILQEFIFTVLRFSVRTFTGYTQFSRVHQLFVSVTHFVVASALKKNGTAILAVSLLPNRL